MNISSVATRLFEDKRLIAVAMVIITLVGIAAFLFTDQSKNDFLRVGPSPNTKILGIVIDTWPRYYFAMSFGFVLTLLNDWFGIALEPWITNSVLDPKALTLPYSKTTCLLICFIKSIYGHIFSVLTFSMLLSQFDLFCARSCADLIVGTTGVWMYIHGKAVVAPGRHPIVDVDMPLMADHSEKGDTSNR